MYLGLDMPKRLFRKNLEILFLSENSRKLVQTLSNVKLSINPAASRSDWMRRCSICSKYV